MVELVTSWLAARGDRQRWLTLVTTLVVLGAGVRLIYLAALDGFWSNSFDQPIGEYTNPAFLEAQSLLNGSISLPQRVHDTAMFNDLARNVFQPGQTLFFLVHLGLGGVAALAGFKLEIVAIALLSAVLLNFALLRLSRFDPLISVGVTVSMMLGAPYLASFPKALNGSIYRANHCFSILLLTAFLALLSLKPNLWRWLGMGACIGGAMLFRAQYILLLPLPLLLLLQSPDGQRWRITSALTDAATQRKLCQRLVLLGLGPALALLIILGFQTARFHNPFENGYMLAYEGRSGYIADRAHEHGLLSFHFLPENLYRTLWAAPEIEINGWRVQQISGDERGNSLIFSQPILLMLPLLWRSWRTAKGQAWLLTSLLLALPVLLYHNPGVYAPGYMRLSLDYAFLWAATLAVCIQMDPASRPVRWLVLPGMLWALGYAELLLRTL